MVAHVDVGKQRIESVKAKMEQNICIFNEWKLRYWGTTLRNAQNLLCGKGKLFAKPFAKQENNLWDHHFCFSSKFRIIFF